MVSAILLHYVIDDPLPTCGTFSDPGSNSGADKFFFSSLKMFFFPRMLSSFFHVLLLHKLLFYLLLLEKKKKKLSAPGFEPGSPKVPRIGKGSSIT